MKKFVLRILLALVIFPLLYVLLFVFNQFHFLGLNFLISAFMFVGAFEVTNFFEKAAIPIYKYSAPILSSLITPIAFCELLIGKESTISFIFFVGILCFFLVRTCFPLARADFSKTLSAVSSSMFVVIYPGFFGSFMIRILSYDSPGFIFFFFLATVFVNEIIAYFGGKLFGKGSKLNLPISPNKTLVGFIAGFLGVVGTCIAFYLLCPWLFKTHIVFIILFGIVMGASGIIGDLFESSLKRSSSIKDSGTIMGGRGGIMDTVDSLLLSAPIFYYLYRLIS
jgi:phosphatidate cytidylyltransferase